MAPRKPVRADDHLQLIVDPSLPKRVILVLVRKLSNNDLLHVGYFSYLIKRASDWEPPASVPVVVPAHAEQC